MFVRALESRLRTALETRPAVMVIGARQVGKTTLCRGLKRSAEPARYLTFDDSATRAAAELDPDGFIDRLRGPVILDEIQLVPSVLPAIKRSIDENREPGRFLLTGSANVLTLPRVSESLVGRMAVLTLWPLSQAEIERSPSIFLDRMFGDESLDVLATTSLRRSVIERALVGGFPEAVTARDANTRAEWHASYLSTLLLRDVRDIANIEGLNLLPRLLALLANRPLAPLNIADLSSATPAPTSTLRRYLTLLETVFLTKLLPPYASNRGKRLVRTPRVAFVDSGLLASVAGLGPERIESEPVLVSPLLENFVLVELWKQASLRVDPPEILYFRSHSGQEVDIVLEGKDGRVVGIEVKATSKVEPRDFRGLEALAEIAGKRFHRGFVLYTGRDTLPFGDRMVAIPMNALWTSL